MAMERVEERLRRVTQALDKTGILHAVVGGNAVAAWVAQVDPAATRTTKDVDLLVRRTDLGRITQTLTALGLRREDLRDLVIFVDPDEPSRRSGIRLVWAGERKSGLPMHIRRRTSTKSCVIRRISRFSICRRSSG
ncbi:MAG: nucleotidyltransferase family protein [Phycisphaerae bacterium]|nr:nucleotidyltransferase family protein [Phycisphaerae bacterium]